MRGSGAGSQEAGAGSSASYSLKNTVVQSVLRTDINMGLGLFSIRNFFIHPPKLTLLDSSGNKTVYTLKEKVNFSSLW